MHHFGGTYHSARHIKQNYQKQAGVSPAENTMTLKIKVKPEGREDIYIPEKESLKAWIKSKGFKQIHNFIPGGMMFIGADHSVESVLEDIDKGERVALVTGQHSGANIGHELAIIYNNKLEVYDIGKITKEDIELI